MIGWKNLPEHVSIHVSPHDIDKLVDRFNMLGFYPPRFQIPKWHVVFSKITTTKFNDLDAELHVRIFSNGKLEAEYEPPRVKKWLDHIFRRSYSAHEYLIGMLEEMGIEYIVDEHSRSLYNEVFPKKFPFVFSEFYHFITGGLLLRIFRPLIRIVRLNPLPPAPLFPLEIWSNITPE